jgi:DNA topoisomerase-1
MATRAPTGQSVQAERIEPIERTPDGMSEGLPPLDPLASARKAGLRHVDPDAIPGITRTRRGRAFAYVDARGKAVRDAKTLERIRKLAIPPAWREVWICPAANGHIQAHGRDARGRKQYRYDARWSAVRSETKFHKMLAFSAVLPRIRAACDRDLRRSELTREKILAAVVRLLELTHIRVGNEEYTRANGSYGLTTLRDRHVRLRGDELRFKFRGKSGQDRDVELRDRRLARVVSECSELPGHELFQYVDADGSRHTIDSGDVNDYIHSIAGDGFTAKDFRTWAGTVLAVRTLRALAPCANRGQAKKNVVECIKAVAAHLGNTPAVCKRSYVHPAVLDAYLGGAIHGVRAASEEHFVRALLRRVERSSGPEGLTAALEASVRVLQKRSGGRRGPRGARLGYPPHDRADRVLERSGGAEVGR